MYFRSLGCAAASACLLTCGCQKPNTPGPVNSPANVRPEVQTAIDEFSVRKSYDPWVLTSNNPNSPIPAYISDGHTGYLVGPNGEPTQILQAGHYVNDHLQPLPLPANKASGQVAQQTLNLQAGIFSTRRVEQSGMAKAADMPFAPDNFHPPDWVKYWNTTDVAISGDPEAQQVAHAQLFSLLSSTFPGSSYSIPPMGLSSTTYQGHIFWDADIWMFPTLVVQHPDLAASIVEYRSKRLPQAIANAKEHHFAGAEFPWESAETGAETAPAEFAQERHITADVAFAAWHYYLWTGDEGYLKTKCWPILKATAQYWTTRATKDGDGSYHVRKVLPPDETAGVVDDDSYTNAMVRYNLRAAAIAAAKLGQTPDPQWKTIASKLVIPQDKERGIPSEHSVPFKDQNKAKQADALLMLWPLEEPYDDATAGKMLDFYAAHTMKSGPAMTAGIHAVVASRLGRSDQALDYYRDSYRPFMRGSWDAFSEKRSTNTVYFLTGMAASLNSIYYGFAGLQVRLNGEKGTGQRIAGDGFASLYANPHLPAGWTGLTIKGISFRGSKVDLTIDSAGKVTTVAAKS